MCFAVQTIQWYNVIRDTQPHVRFLLITNQSVSLLEQSTGANFGLQFQSLVLCVTADVSAETVWHDTLLILTYKGHHAKNAVDVPHSFSENFQRQSTLSRKWLQKNEESLARLILSPYINSICPTVISYLGMLRRLQKGDLEKSIWVVSTAQGGGSFNDRKLLRGELMWCPPCLFIYLSIYLSVVQCSCSCCSCSCCSCSVVWCGVVWCTVV
jgi:hypothetical protein